MIWLNFILLNEYFIAKLNPTRIVGIGLLCSLYSQIKFGCIPRFVSAKMIASN